MKLYQKKWFIGLSLAIFFALLAGTILYPFLFQHRAFFDLDVALLQYPYSDFYIQAIRSGQNILWNPHIFSGFPSYLSQSAFLDPVNFLLFRFLDVFAGTHLRHFLNYFLTLIFSYLAGRTFGVSWPASLLIGPGFLLASDWRLLSDPMVSNGVFLTPFLFFIFGKILPRASPREMNVQKWLWLLGGGLGLGWALLSSDTQLIIYTLTLLGIFTVLHFFFLYTGEKNFSAVSMFIIILLVLVGVGFIISLPHTLPALKYLSLSTRSQGLTYKEAVIKPVEPGDIVGFAFPDYSYFPYVSPGQKYLYVGALWFILALAGYLYAYKKKIMIVLGSLFIFSFLTALRWSPLFYFMHQLPIFKYFRAPYRWIEVGIFFLSVMGAYGFDTLRENAGNKKLKNLTIVLAILAGGFTLLVSTLNFLNSNLRLRMGNLLTKIFASIFYGKLGFIKDAEYYQSAIQKGVAAWREFTGLSHTSFSFPLAALIISLLLIAAFLWKYISWGYFRVLTVLISLIIFLGTFIIQWPLISVPQQLARESHDALLQKFIPTRDYLLYRTFPFMLDYGFAKVVPPQFKLSEEEEYAVGQLQFASGWPNIHTFSGVNSVDGYDLLVPQKYLKVLETLGSTHGGQEATQKLSVQEKTQRLLSHLDLLGMMAGKYIVSGIELKHPDLRLLGIERITKYQVPLFIYENKKALPKIYFAKNIISSAAPQDDIILSGTNFKNNTYLSCDPCQNKTAPAGGKKLTILSLKNGYFEIQTETPSPVWLVVSESFIPGWKTEIDGISEKIISANGLYMAVLAPQGKHKITLHYEGVLQEYRLYKIIYGL